MKLIEMKNLRVAVLIVDLPEDVIDITVKSGIIFSYHESAEEIKYIKLPPRNWELFCKLDQMKEEQADNIVHEPFWDDDYAYMVYRDYEKPGVVSTAIESFESAIEAEGYAIIDDFTKRHLCSINNKLERNIDLFGDKLLDKSLCWVLIQKS